MRCELFVIHKYIEILRAIEHGVFPLYANTFPSVEMITTCSSACRFHTMVVQNLFLRFPKRTGAWYKSLIICQDEQQEKYRHYQDYDPQIGRFINADTYIRFLKQSEMVSRK